MLVKGKKIHGKPLVSAVIAAHNEEKVLGKCINSLLNQSYKNIEIIIVENGDSTDKTLGVAQKYAKKHKKIQAFSIPGRQKGPGVAWNYGIKKSKGKIIMSCGADLIYGKDYVKDGIKPILEGKTVGTIHNKEKCANLENLWARTYFCKRSVVDDKGLAPLFFLIRKDYVLKHLYDSSHGYSDDQTIYRKIGTEFLGMDLEVGHINPDTFSETWAHDIWVGSSYTKPLITILFFPLFLFWAIYKTIWHLTMKDFYWKFIFFLPIFYSLRYFGYFIGAFQRILES